MQKIITALYLACLLAACSSPDSENEQPGTPDASGSSDSAPEAEMATPAAAKPSTQLVVAEDFPDEEEEPKSPQEIAKLLGTKHSGLTARNIIVLMVTEVDFPSSALGCPDPDMSYLAVITPGYKVLVRAGGDDLDVRIAGQSGFVCEPEPEIPPKD